MKKVTPEQHCTGPIIEPVFGYAISFGQACEITDKTPRTIRKWNKEGWPKPYFDLVTLHAMGRVVPIKWEHCFFNTRGNLVVNGDGEVAENDILNIPHLRILNNDLQRALNNKIDSLKDKLGKAEENISNLQDLLEDTLPGEAAANDRFQTREVC